MDDEEYEQALVDLRRYQGGRCAVCWESRRQLWTDHDHETGLVRGLLCHSCNVREGQEAFAPWFEAYRSNPPAAQIGLVLLHRDGANNVTQPGTPRRQVGRQAMKVVPSTGLREIVGVRLRNFRVAQGLTQAEVAYLMGVTVRYWSGLEVVANTI